MAKEAFVIVYEVRIWRIQKDILTFHVVDIASLDTKKTMAPLVS